MGVCGFLSELACVGWYNIVFSGFRGILSGGFDGCSFDFLVWVGL